MRITGENVTRAALNELLLHPHDCLVIVHPEVYVLDQASRIMQVHMDAVININKELSAILMSIPVDERGRSLQTWLVDTLTVTQDSPVLFKNIDLLFEPSLNIDPLVLLRQIARIKPLIVMWLGEFVNGNLSYAIPEHKHYRSWRVTDALLQQPSVLIYRISSSQGA